MTELELKSKLKSQDRTKAQTKALELKQRGYNITRIVNDFEEVVAFGYTLNEVPRELNLVHVEEVIKFDFIYYN